jgi:hypothetical protein
MDLVTSLPRAECVRRLQKAVGSEWTAFGMRGVVAGSITDQWFSLQKFTTFHHESLIILFGELIEEGGATRIRCRSGTNWLLKVFSAAFVTFEIYVAIRNHTLIIPFLSVACFGAIFGFVLFAQKYDFDFVLAFVRDKLETRDVPLQKPASSSAVGMFDSRERTSPRATSTPAAPDVR